MQTLAIVNGDLVLGSGSYVTVSGPNRIKQDLYYALREEYGGDPFHPLWGSILDRFIGLPFTTTVQQSVLNEVNRVVTNYISVQTDQVNSHATAGTKSTMGTADVVSDIEDITAYGTGDNMQVEVTLRTVAGQTLTVSTSVGV